MPAVNLAGVMQRATAAPVGASRRAPLPAVAGARGIASFQPRRLAPCRASETETQAKASPAPTASSGPVEYIPDDEFSISKVSFGSILTPLGSFLLIYGFGAFFTFLPGGDVSSLMLIYGFPMALLGAALSYAQLEPAPCKTTKAAFERRAKEMTDIQKQIREDCTRFRYGDEQHLEEALEKVFKYAAPGSIRRNQAPVLTGLREEIVDDHYCLVLEFESKFDFAVWEAKEPKIASFFGPGIYTKIEKKEKGADVYLISDGSGNGITGIEKKDVLIPLLPGLKPRQQ
mmetsp:Transcript_34218/g.101696  ORF Transcript_34218/g.101696 Transcript_34218/m.101696 type:complete len:287 (-) Transcript_34218:232-1092(-)